MLLEIFISTLVFTAATANECSYGEPNYVCKNLNLCADMFGGMENLKLFCEIQGFRFEDEGPTDMIGSTVEDMVVIISPPRNVTVPKRASVTFSCSADNAIKVVIAKSSDMTDRSMKLTTGTATKQTAIQEIDEALKELEGWYVCTAYGLDGQVVAAEAYLEIRDVCANNDCQLPKVCVADRYTGTYECRCPSDCGVDFDPVCGSDCASYFNECTMKKETCERGDTGVTVMSKGLCSFTPEKPIFISYPKYEKFKQGEQMTMSVEVSGTPDPEIVWFVDDVKVGEGESFFGTMKEMYAGRWKVEATVCMRKFWASREYSVEMEEVDEVLVEPTLQCCKVYGDPHVITFDQKKFDYMGAGTYILALDRENGDWMVYGSLERCGDLTKQLSCITSITIFYREYSVQLLRMWRVSNNGQEFKINSGESRSLGGIKIENVNLEYVVTIGDTGVVAKWDGLITAQVCLAKCADNVYGLCGDANCDATNDFDRRGFMNPYTRSWAAKTSSEFGNSWCVDGESCEMEPEDGNLADERRRPCNYIPSAEFTAIMARCQAVADLEAFARLVETTFDKDVALTNCYFDSCGGLLFNGCANKDSTQCPGVSVDPACLMGMDFARVLQAWGLNVGNDWRSQLDPVCPTDEEVRTVMVCPT